VEAKVETLIKEIINICVRLGDVEEIILYGSRAKGVHLPKSDLDIAIKGKNFDIDELADHIDELDTLLGVDLVDFYKCKNELLVKEIEKDGITLYRKI